MAAVLQDSAVAVSIALQHGVKASELAKSMSRQPSLAWRPNAEPASVIGVAFGHHGGDDNNIAPYFVT